MLWWETKRGSPAGANYPRGCGNPEYGDSGVIRIRCRAGDLRAGSGYFQNVRVIGDIVEAGDTIAEIWQEDGTKLLVQTQIKQAFCEVFFAGWLSGDGTFQGSRCRSEKRGTFQLFSDLG